ncbi:unnamed protein product [Adineta steineri]|uniref:Autophagy-related protein 27 n=1 Tax=Adineta steineri TaxID=433720 RepID=A0A815CM16_9BILA|nr:unnamed protein product [Adineta steineri]CAF4010051.1 unnamed protein product [Adineta steineri]
MTLRFWLTIITINCALLTSSVIADDPCRYETTKGVIDLTSVGRTDGKPAYADKTPPASADYKYSYNPCKPFTELPNCVGVAACQVSADGKLSFSLGKQESVKWNPGAGLGSIPSITYTEGPKVVTVTLVCSTDGSEDFDALGESPTNNYKFRLTHKCACWDGCAHTPPQPTTKSPGGGGGGGLGGGGAFVIILLVLAIVYFAGFASYYKFRQQKSGAELIPHRTFWVALPGYAKDGAVYVFRRVSGKGAESYNSV